MCERASYHILIYGKVQHVGFRKWALETGNAAGLTGWVRNRPDGRVELMITGTSDCLDAFVATLANGYAQADVIGVDARVVSTKSFSSFVRKPTGPKGRQPATEIIERLDPLYLAACQKAVATVPSMTCYTEKRGRWRFGQITDAAEKYGIEKVHLGPNAPPSMICRMKDFTFGLDVSRPSWVSPITDELSNNKFLSKVMLDSFGVPILKGIICRTSQEAMEAFAEIGGSVVVKPVFGTESKGVSLNVSTLQAVERAFAHALNEGRHGLVLVEEYMAGVDLRLLLVGDKLVAAYLRLPAHVIGDGTLSITQLVAQKNAARSTLPSTQESHLLRINLPQRRLLTLQGYAPNHVPDAGKIVLLGVSPNYIDGADLMEISDCLNPDIATIATKAARAIDPQAFWGIDLLSEDVTASTDTAKTAICEVNSRPAGGVFRYATHGSHVPFYSSVFDALTKSPKYFTPSEPNPAVELKVRTDLQAPGRLEDQTATIIQSNLTGAFPLTSNILVHRTDFETSFIALNPNPSFIRSALFPWRWLSLREEMARHGVPLTNLSADLAPTPYLGRVFLVKKRNKMRTIRLTSPEHLHQIQTNYADRRVLVERYHATDLTHIAMIGGIPIAMAEVGESTKTTRSIPNEIEKICGSLRSLLPGFTLGTILFRPDIDGVLAVSEILPSIDTKPFLMPDIGSPIDLAHLQAEHAVGNARTFGVNLSQQLLRKACF
ncbi:acylphosphatase [Tateyamaria sp.]|uniref:acylphosphatase n=1 Tax=Tateyamaria sp. TaxID=1929288 RepID=UPI0032A121F9